MLTLQQSPGIGPLFPVSVPGGLRTGTAVPLYGCISPLTVPLQGQGRSGGRSYLIHRYTELLLSVILTHPMGMIKRCKLAWLYGGVRNSKREFLSHSLELDPNLLFKRAYFIKEELKQTLRVIFSISGLEHNIAHASFYYKCHEMFNVQTFPI